MPLPRLAPPPVHGGGALCMADAHNPSRSRVETGAALFFVGRGGCRRMTVAGVAGSGL